jgi:anaerobic ribonucleoside-triphosphate reductase activating protein
MGGEPLCEQNQEFTLYLIEELKKEIPDLKIYLYTGYTLSQLDKNNSDKTILNNIFKHLEWLIAGPFILDKRDITLMYRGSTNQIIYQGPLTFQEKDDIIELNIDEEIKEKVRWLQTF